MKLLPFVLLIFAVLPASAQMRLDGRVADGLTGELLPGAIVENLTSTFRTLSDGSGNFSLPIGPGDTVEVRLLGYLPRKLTILDATLIQYRQVILQPAIIAIDTVTISPGYTPYQQDSLDNRAIFGRKVEQQQAKLKVKGFTAGTGFGLILENPISAPFQALAPKYKRLRRFQKRFKADERQKFIDTRYTRQLTETLTGLEGDSLAFFMNAYPMDYYFCRAATELELKLWIRHNYREWIGRRDD